MFSTLFVPIEEVSRTPERHATRGSIRARKVFVLRRACPGGAGQWACACCGTRSLSGHFVSCWPTGPPPPRPSSSCWPSPSNGSGQTKARAAPSLRSRRYAACGPSAHTSARTRPQAFSAPRCGPLRRSQPPHGGPGRWWASGRGGPTKASAAPSCRDGEVFLRSHSFAPQLIFTSEGLALRNFQKEKTP
jgi:hypothetical protein